MRLWTLHPKYLDPRGLVALWREGLLAQAVIGGQTRGYQHHPQLLRFRASTTPLATIAGYLHGVHAESLRRGYRFDASKITTAATVASVRLVEATQGQLDYEWAHLKEKLRLRAPSCLAEIQSIEHPEPHPLFRIVPGTVADWEVVKGRR